MLYALFVPMVLFAAVYAARTFSLRCSSPNLTSLFVALCLGVVVVCALLAVEATARRLRGEIKRSPAWWLFLAFTCAGAWILGLVLGNANFYSNTQPWCDLSDLSVYPAVDPASASGRQLMDAGRVEFLKGSKLDLDHTMAFKNKDQFCVAPIVGESGFKAGAEIDFWAVGLNCCSGTATDFHCGEYGNANARSGLRLMREDQRSFYRLAVQQAEAAYGVKAPHPLFFFWLEDYNEEMDLYQEDALKFFGLGVLCFFALQVVLVLIAQVTFSKLGVI